MPDQHFTFTLPTGESDLQRGQMVIFNMVAVLKLAQQYVLEMESEAATGIGDGQATKYLLDGLKVDYDSAYLDVDGQRQIGSVACISHGQGYRVRMTIERVDESEE